MDHGFTLVPVRMLFLYHSGAVMIRFPLLNNRAVAIPISIMAFANGCATPTGPTRTPTSSAKAGVAIAATAAIIPFYIAQQKRLLKVPATRLAIRTFLWRGQIREELKHNVPRSFEEIWELPP
jgi:hypothetical protein